MGQSFNSEVRKRLLAEEYGEQVAPGFYMQDIGRDIGQPGPTLTTDPLKVTPPKTRAERRRVAEEMAAKLMDWYMSPDVLNDTAILNPIRDGIPQCSAHKFVKGSSVHIGCIHGCGARERDNGSLPVAREGTVADVWQWVKALIELAVTQQDQRTGFAVKPDLTPGR
jgi:hypothetical protein